MAKYRRGRINDAVFQESAIALRNLRDPRIQNAFVSITRAEVAPDLKFAKIYFSCMGGEEAEKEARTALRNAAGYFRHHLAETLNLRITPELMFVPDHAMEHGARIAKLLREIENTAPASAPEAEERQEAVSTDKEIESDEAEGEAENA